MTGYEYACPECGARVSSGWADPVCPIPTCGAPMRLLAGPEPAPEEIEQVIREAEGLLEEAA